MDILIAEACFVVEDMGDLNSVPALTFVAILRSIYCIIFIFQCVIYLSWKQYILVYARFELFLAPIVIAIF